MKCESCNADMANGAKYCALCGKGKNAFHVDCPYCQHHMEKGVAQIHSSFPQILITGIGSQNLYFKQDEKKDKKVMTSKEELEAFFCTNCESIFILPQ